MKKSSDFSDPEIKTILDTWDIVERKEMNADDFKRRFERSEFHLLTGPDQNKLSIV